MDTSRIKEILQDPKTRKILLIAGGSLVVILMILIVVALVSSKNNNTPTNTSEGTTTNNGTSGQITINYWGLWEPDGVMSGVIKDFENANPGVTVLYSQQRFSTYESRIYTRLQQAYNSTEPAPDVFRIHNTWLPKFRKYLAPLPSTIMTKDEYASTFYPTAVEDFTGKDGLIYAIPWEIDGLAVFYNKKIFEDAGVTEVPKDWDSFFELATKLTTKDSSGKIIQSGVALGTSTNIKHASEILSFLFLQEGMQVIDSTKTTVTLNTAKGQKVLNQYTNFAMGDTATWSSTLRSDLEMFFAGKLAMMIAPSWRAFDIIDAAPQIEFGIAPLPQLKANDYEIYYSTYWGDAVNSTSPNKEMAWKFVKYLSEKETEQKLYSASSTVRAFGEPYSRVDLRDQMIGKPYVSAIAEMAPYMKSWQMGDESYVKSVLNDAITSVVENGKEVSTALKNAESAINSRLAQTNK